MLSQLQQVPMLFLDIILRRLRRSPFGFDRGTQKSDGEEKPRAEQGNWSRRGLSEQLMFKYNIQYTGIYTMGTHETPSFLELSRSNAYF